VIYPSIGNFIWSRKKYTFGGQKGENKQSEPKNGILAKEWKNITHDHTDFEAQIPLLGSDTLFSSF
jgi:hypothetical protein